MKMKVKPNSENFRNVLKLGHKVRVLTKRNSLENTHPGFLGIIIQKIQALFWRIHPCLTDSSMERVDGIIVSRIKKSTDWENGHVEVSCLLGHNTKEFVTIIRVPLSHVLWVK